MAKIQDKQVASYGVMTIYNVTDMCWFSKSVANCNRCLTYKGGQLHRFSCINIHQMLVFFFLNYDVQKYEAVTKT